VAGNYSLQNTQWVRGGGKSFRKYEEKILCCLVKIFLNFFYLFPSINIIFVSTNKNGSALDK